MNLISILLWIYSACTCTEASVTVLHGETKAEVFNSIDNFSQYHSNSFKLNLFRSNSGEKDEEGNKGIKYIFGIDNYSDDSQVFEVGTFYLPEIIKVSRRFSSLQMEIEHGHYDHRKISLITVTSDDVAISENVY